MKIILLLGMLSISSFAHDDEINSCDSEVTLAEITSLSKKLMAWYGAESKDISKAPCKTKNVPSEEKMRSYIESKISGSESKSVNGVQLQDESPILVQAFTDLTTVRDPYGSRIVKNAQKDFQREFNINPACQKVMCALEKIWGKEMALKILYVKLKHEFNMSEYAFQESSRFRKDEMDDAIKGLEDFPGHLLPVATKNQRLTMYTRGSLPPEDEGTKVNATAVVMLFDNWSKYDSANRQYIMFHEISHNLSSKLNNMDESPEWMAISGWVQYNYNDWEATNPKKCFISSYSKANAWEDFAETFSAYRYNGAALKNKCPTKYNFMKTKVMNGIEYLSESTCRP